MTFVSYAPNFEDVMLWRALQTVQAGFYVDAGAVHPDSLSVTRGFYDRGWSGLNVLSREAGLGRMRAARPRDTSIACVLGAEAGEAALFVPHDPALATTDPDTADVLRTLGKPPVERQVTTRTLSDVLATHAPQPATRDIHFLRVDAAGAEADVLRGADFTRYRHWIIVVRAVRPESNQATTQLWETGLIGAGYVFAWFDALNRFYVAEEHTTALLPHFTTPANLFDDFVRAADTELASRIAAAEAMAQAQADRASTAEVRALEETARLIEIRLLNEHRLQQIHALEAERDAANTRAALATDRIESLRRTTSWRITGPLRILTRKLLRRTGADDEIQSMPPPPPLSNATPPDFTRRPAVTAMPAPRLPRRAVHQFHPGSARGDAVTNAMLLIQRLLQGLGYASEIFCAQPDPDIRPRLRPMDELPLHGDYVLLVHFSLGFDAFDSIADLPAGKVLMYHNITPPELLDGAEMLQELARLGRRQLPLWRDRVAAGLAVSEFNALELRSHDFPVARACPLLFDVDAMIAAAAMPSPPREDDVFTVLFVGRIVQSKAQHDLVAAFAAFRERFSRPSRLVLVGRAQQSGDVYIDHLRAHIAELGLTAHVVFTGFVDDAGLRRAYHHADLYVSLSHHEGFGVPLVEAMAHGVPVLAWPCGAVPYTLGDASELLTDRAPEAVAHRMLELANDPARMAAIVRQQRRSLDRFRLAHHVPVLLQALALAGAAPPERPETHGQVAENLRFTVMGHINGSYSLAGINRGLARSIEAERPGRVRVVAVEGAPTTDLSGVPAEQAPAITTLSGRPAFETGPDVIISQHYPVYVPDARSDAALAMFFWEESVIPIETVRVLNAGFRGVLAPSTFVARVLVNSGVRIPVRMVGQSPDLSAFRSLGEDRRTRRATTGVTTFLHVSSCLPRKGVDLLLTAFARSFRRGDAVRLVIKGYPNPHNEVPEMLAALQAADPDLPEIELINRDLDFPAILDLYRDADVMVLPTRGEGFNLPAAEAMAARIPLIVTAFGGQSDFCDDSTARLLAWRFAPSQSHLASVDSLWVEPSADDLATALREAAEQSGPLAQTRSARVRAAAARVDATLNDRRFVNAIVNAAAHCVLRPPPRPPRMTWITTWDVRCGVAEYSRHLLTAWPHDAAGEVTILADDRTQPATDFNARIAWRLGRPENAADLAKIIEQVDPEVVVIQHQPGLLDWPVLARLLRSEALLRRIVTVTLHNTLHLWDIAADLRADVINALKGATRVIVHGVGDLERLTGAGLSGNLVMMPHGVPARATHIAARTLTAESAPVVGCYGFFLPGKGIAQLIEAIAALLPIWPKLRLRLVNAAYGTPDSDAEIARCRQAAEAAGVAGAIDWHTEFLPETDSQALLAGCDLVVLPYQASRESSSAALRSVLSAGAPVATTPLSVFDDAEPAIARLPGLDAAAIATGVAALLHDTARRDALLAAAAEFAASRTWPMVAERMEGMLHGLMNSIPARDLTQKDPKCP